SPPPPACYTLSLHYALPIFLAKFDGAMREIVQTSLIVFLVSGALLTFERLSRGAASATYVWLLVLKVALALVMFQVGFRLRGARSEEHTSELQSRFDLVCRL